MPSNLSDDDINRRIEVAKKHIAEERKPAMSKGELALLSMSCYQAALVPPGHWPEGALREVVSCYRHFTEGKPGGAYSPGQVLKGPAPLTRHGRRQRAGAPGQVLNRPAPLTLGEAFGIKDHHGASRGGKSAATAHKRAQSALIRPQVVALKQSTKEDGKKYSDEEIAEILSERLTKEKAEVRAQEHMAMYRRFQGLAPDEILPKKVADRIRAESLNDETRVKVTRYMVSQVMKGE